MNLTSLTIQTNFLLCTQTFEPKRLTQKPRRTGDRFGSMGKGVWGQGSVLPSVTADGGVGGGESRSTLAQSSHSLAGKER